MPVHSFNAGDVLDKDTFYNGPLDVYIGQDEWIPCNKDIDLEPWKAPRRKLWQWFLLRRKYAFAFRVEPAEGEDLVEFGRIVAEALGMPVPSAEDYGPEDKAVWVSGYCWGRLPSSVIGSVGRAFKRLDNIYIKRAQIRAISVEKLDELYG